MSSYGEANDMLSELALDGAQLTADVAGIIEPSPFADATSGAISLYRHDWLGAGLSVASMIPYLGDAVAKPFKDSQLLARMTTRVENLIELLPKLKKEGGAAAELAAKIEDTLASLKGAFCNLPGAKALCRMLAEHAAKAAREAEEAAAKAAKGTDEAAGTARAAETSKSPYGHLEDPPNTGAGKDPTPEQRAKIIEANKARNGGVVKSDDPNDYFSELVKPEKSRKGVTPPKNEWQIDHIVPKDKGGTNSYDNLRIISRKLNREKSNK